MDCFDADVLIYAVIDGHELGLGVRELFQDKEGTDELVGIGSVVLIPELLTKSTRTGDSRQLEALLPMLARLDLLPVDKATSHLAVALGAKYGLKAADSIHLATGVKAGADRFVTNNRKDFPSEISEIQIVRPGML